MSFLEIPPRRPMVCHFGETDMLNTPPEVIKAVKDAIPGAETYIHRAVHAFANDARKTYVADAAIKARERSLAFLNANHK